VCLPKKGRDLPKCLPKDTLGKSAIQENKSVMTINKGSRREMTKFTKALFVLSLAVAASFGLTACDDDKSSGVSNQFVIGNDG
jgi:hypothetical protein